MYIGEGGGGNRNSSRSCALRRTLEDGISFALNINNFSILPMAVRGSRQFFFLLLLNSKHRKFTRNALSSSVALCVISCAFNFHNLLSFSLRRNYSLRAIKWRQHKLPSIGDNWLSLDFIIHFIPTKKCSRKIKLFFSFLCFQFDDDEERIHLNV